MSEKSVKINRIQVGQIRSSIESSNGRTQEMLSEFTTQRELLTNTWQGNGGKSFQTAFSEVETSCRKVLQYLEERKNKLVEISTSFTELDEKTSNTLSSMISGIEGVVSNLSSTETKVK